MPTIDEAVALLEQEAVDNQHEGDMVLVDAIKLAIGALKVIGYWNEKQLPQHQIHLSRETEELNDANSRRT